MADEITTVDDIVIQHAAKQKEDTGGTPPEKVIEKVDPPAGGTETKGDPVAPQAKTDPPPVTPNPIDDLLKELGVENMEALKERLKLKDPDKPESPEEKARKESIYQASLQKYAVEKGIMKLEDFPKMESIKTKADTDLVFENWLPAWKEENPDIDPEDAAKIAKEDFEAEYKINSDNEKTKARGLAKISKEALEIRTPLEKAYKAVKENYEGVRDLETNFPEFNKKVTGLLKDYIPEKFTVFKVKDGEEEIPIEMELTAAERVEILNKVGKDILENEANYELYKKGDIKSIQALGKEKAESIIRERLRDAAAQKIATDFLTRGRKSAPGIGAKNPFPLVGDGKVDEGKANLSPRDEIMNQPAFKR